MDVLLYWGIFLGAMAVCTWTAFHDQDHRPPTHYDGIHKVRNRKGRK